MVATLVMEEVVVVWVQQRQVVGVATLVEGEVVEVWVRQ